MKEEQRKERDAEMVFEANLEAFFEGATDEEVEACQRGVMRDG